MTTSLERHKIDHIKLGINYTGYDTSDFGVLNNNLYIKDSGIDHGSISGLSDDDHSIYAFLTGRSGGQTLTGGIDSGDDLTLQSTSNDTRGDILFGNSGFDEVNEVLYLNKNGSGDRNSEIRLFSDDTWTDWSFIIQNNSSENGARKIASRGTGDLVLKTVDAAELHLGTDNDENHLVIASGGIVTLQNDLFIGDSSTSAEDRRIKIGLGRTDNGHSYVDLIGDTTYTDYGLRLIRNNGGANTNSSLYHRGTGALILQTIDAGAIQLNTNNINAITVDTSQRIGIGTNSPSVLLDVNSDSVRIRTSQSPASNGTGVQGEIAWDSDYLYVCYATNSWGRVALTKGY
jgi:hypothetical protein